MKRRLMIATIAGASLMFSVASGAAAQQTAPEPSYGAGAGVAGARQLPDTGSGPGTETMNPVIAASIVSAGTAVGAFALLRRRAGTTIR